MSGNIRNPYRTSNFNGIELDLRQELHNLLYGSSDEIAKGRIGLLRKMRKNSSNEFIRCPCRDKLTDEPNRDHYCRSCHGHGYFWDETKIVYYKNDEAFQRQPGLVQENESNLFYIEYTEDISSSDFIIEIKLDNNGNPIIPVVRTKVYEILSADQFKADYGRVEFWQIRAKFRREWSVWYGTKLRTNK